jgi:hypothetical protein
MMYPRANIIEKTGNHIIIFVVDVVDGLLLAFQPLNISNLLIAVRMLRVGRHV